MECPPASRTFHLLQFCGGDVRGKKLSSVIGFFSCMPQAITNYFSVELDFMFWISSPPLLHSLSIMGCVVPKVELW